MYNVYCIEKENFFKNPEIYRKKDLGETKISR